MSAYAYNVFVPFSKFLHAKDDIDSVSRFDLFKCIVLDVLRTYAGLFQFFRKKERIESKKLVERF